MNSDKQFYFFGDLNFKTNLISMFSGSISRVEIFIISKGVFYLELRLK